MAETFHGSESRTEVIRSAVDTVELFKLAQAENERPPELTPNPDIQNKIVRSIVYAESGHFGNDVEPLPGGAREAALNWLGDGRVTEDEVQSIVQEGSTPWESPEGAAAPYDSGKLFETSQALGAVQAHQELLTILTDGDAAGLEPRSDAQRLVVLAALVDERPNPVGVAEAAMNKLKVARISEQSRETLAADIPAFLRETYGEQAEILEQVNLMKAEATDRAVSESKTEPISQKDREGVGRLLEARAAVEVHGAETEAEPAEQEPYKNLTPEQTKSIMGRAEIHGSPYYDRDSRTTTELTPDMLAKAGLDPKYYLQLEEMNMYFSEPYMNADNRMSVITYMDTSDDKIVARNLYKSNSGDLRRLHQMHWPNGHYDKGPGESSLPPPFEVQAALAKISQHEPLHVERPDVMFHGTASDINVEVNTFAGEIAPRPEKLTGNFYVEGGGNRLVPPEQADFTDPNEAPDYAGEPMLSWDDKSEQRGKFKVEVYPSKDGKRRFAVATDEQGRSNFLGVENVGGPLTKTGEKKQWVEAGALTTPMYEYGTQSGGYADTSDKKGDYYSMWENYHSKLPEVQRYQAAMAKKSAKAQRQ